MTGVRARALLFGTTEPPLLASPTCPTVLSCVCVCPPPPPPPAVCPGACLFIGWFHNHPCLGLGHLSGSVCGPGPAASAGGVSQLPTCEL